MRFTSLATHSVTAAVLTAALCSCSSAAPAAASPEQATTEPPPQPGDGGLAQPTPIKVSDSGPSGSSPGPRTSKDDDGNVPGGGSSAPPTNEVETDEGEEIMLGTLPTLGPPGSTGLSSSQPAGREALARAIQRATKARKPQLKKCRKAALAANPGLRGKLDVTFVVGTDGKTRNVKIEHSTTGDDELNRCVVAELEQLEVAPPPTEDARVVLPIVIAGPNA